MTLPRLRSVLSIHPRVGALDEFARGVLDGPARGRVAGHLEHCLRCRRAVVIGREIMSAARQSGATPQPRRELLERALARRAAGERVILPLEDPRVPLVGGRRAVTSAAVAAVLVIGLALALITRSRDVLAGDTDGVLHVAPSLPRPESRITVQYDAPAAFAHESQLVLRVRLLTPDVDAYEPGRYLTIPLTRGHGDRFDGAFTLPDSTVYAAMVVEDTAGNHIDTHANRFWEILTSADGRAPSYAALAAQENAWMGRSWEAGYAAAREAARLYPDDPRSWNVLRFFQQSVLASSALDSLAPRQRARFVEFHRRLAAQRQVSGDLMGTMYFYAWTVGDSAKKAYWDARLRREAPANPFTVQNRLAEIVGPLWHRDSLTALAAYENLWREVASVPGALTHQGGMLPRLGFDAAVRLHDVDATKRWASRLVSVSPADSFSVAAELVKIPALRDSGFAWMRRRIAVAAVPIDAERRLDRTRRDHARQAQYRYGQMLGRYGEALLGLREWRAAADTLDLAASIGWRPDLMRAAANAHLALGDTATAVRLLAGLAVDPETADSARVRVQALAAHIDARVWHAWTDSAATRMRDFVLAGGVDKPLRGDIQLRASDSQATRSMADVIRGHPAVVIVWSAHCGPALEAIPDIERLTQRLGLSGTPVIVIGDSLTAEDRATLRAKGGTFPVYADVGHRAQQAFSNFGTPAFYVLDGAGHVRFEWAQPAEIIRDLAVLGPAPVSGLR